MEVPKRLRRAAARLREAAAHELAPVDKPVEPPQALVDALDDLKLLGDAMVRSKLRSTHRRFMAAINGPAPRDQETINRLRAQLPRPISDRDFWDLVFQPGRFRKTT